MPRETLISPPTMSQAQRTAPPCETQASPSLQPQPIQTSGRAFSITALLLLRGFLCRLLGGRRRELLADGVDVDLQPLRLGEENLLIKVKELGIDHAHEIVMALALRELPDRPLGSEGLRP